MSNLDPGLTRRAQAADASEVLEWARMPLATVEVAALLGSDAKSARTRLEEVALFQPVGEDGHWSLTA